MDCAKYVAIASSVTSYGSEVGLGTLRNFRRRTAAAIRQLEDIQPVEKLFGGGADHRLPQRTPSTSRSSPRSRSNAPNISPHRHALDSVFALDQDHTVGPFIGAPTHSHFQRGIDIVEVPTYPLTDAALFSCFGR